MRTTLLLVLAVTLSFVAVAPAAEADHEGCGERPVDVCSHHYQQYDCIYVWVLGNPALQPLCIM